MRCLTGTHWRARLGNRDSHRILARIPCFAQLISFFRHAKAW
jgi:hypothetical protein